MGNIGPGATQFNAPQGLAWTQRHPTRRRQNNCRIQQYNDAGTWFALWGSLLVDYGDLSSPTDVYIDPSGNVSVADSQNRASSNYLFGHVHHPWGSLGTGSAQFNTPSGLSADSSGFLYVADTGNHRTQSSRHQSTRHPCGAPRVAERAIRKPAGHRPRLEQQRLRGGHGKQPGSKIQLDGRFSPQVGVRAGTGNDQFNSPSAVAVNSTGAVYVADTGNHRIQKFTSLGVYV